MDQTLSPFSPLLKLPVEILRCIADHARPKGATICALARSCRALHGLTNYLLYVQGAISTWETGCANEKYDGLTGRSLLVYAIKKDCPDLIRRMAAFHKNEQVPLNPFDTDLALSYALNSDRLHVVKALLDVGADIIWGGEAGLEELRSRAPCLQKHVRQSRRAVFGDNLGKGYYSSLVAAALTSCEYDPCINSYKDERDFWRCKKKILLRILWKRRLAAIRTRHKHPEHLSSELRVLQEEINVALQGAAFVDDAHSTDAMSFLARAGGDLSWQPSPAYRCNLRTPLAGALNASTKHTFKAKIDCLVRHGVDVGPEALKDWKHPNPTTLLEEIHRRLQCEVDGWCSDGDLPTDTFSYWKTEYLDQLARRRWQEKGNDALPAPRSMIESFIESQPHTVRIDDYGTYELEQPSEGDPQFCEIRHACGFRDAREDLSDRSRVWFRAMCVTARFYRYHGLDQDLSSMKRDMIEAWRVHSEDSKSVCDNRFCWLHESGNVFDGTAAMWTRLLQNLGHEISEEEKKHLE